MELIRDGGVRTLQGANVPFTWDLLPGPVSVSSLGADFQEGFVGAACLGIGVRSAGLDALGIHTVQAFVTCPIPLFKC